jgi:multidrug resistance protein MdtO
MATLAIEPGARPLAGLLALLRPQPGRLEFAARLATICALTTLIAEFYQTPDPALTTYVAFFVMKPDRMGSVAISIVLMLVITLVLGMVLLAAVFVMDDPFWRVAVMATMSFCLVFATSASKLRPVGNIIALIAIYGLDVLGTLQIGEVATRALLYVWLFVGIPAIVAIVVNLLAGPPPRRLAERALAHRLILAASLLRRADSEARRAFDEALAEGTGEIQTWLRLAGTEKSASAEHLAALRHAAESITEILLLVRLADRAALAADARESIAATLAEMAAILERGLYPTEIVLEIGQDAPTPDGVAILAELKAALAQFTVAAPADAPAAKAPGGFFLPDAFTNPAHVRYALKTTAAAMFCYAFYSLLDWRAIHTCLITCYIVALSTTAETVEKLTLRIVGCLVGGAAGLAAIVFLMPGITSIGGLMAVVFAAGLASGWVAAGGPRIAYAGFQMAFAFYLCTIQGSAPAFDLPVARDRVIGILFGNLVVYLVFTTLWPVSIARRIDPAITAILRSLGALATATSVARRRALASATQTALSALDQDLALLPYEPATVCPAAHWIEARRQAAAAIAALEGPLLVPAQSARDDIARRLGSLADRLADGSQALPWERGASHPSTAAPGALETEIATQLDSLERAFLQRPAEIGAGTYAPA